VGRQLPSILPFLQSHRLTAFDRATLWLEQTSTLTASERPRFTVDQFLSSFRRGTSRPERPSVSHASRESIAADVGAHDISPRHCSAERFEPFLQQQGLEQRGDCEPRSVAVARSVSHTVDRHQDPVRELEGRCATFKAANVRLFHECEKLKVRGVHLEELNLRFARTLQQLRKDHQLEIAGLRRELEAAQSTLQEIDSANRKVKKMALRGKDVKKASQSRETQTTEGGHFFGEQAFDSSVMEACSLVVEPEAVSATPRFSQDCLEEVGPAVRELRGTALPSNHPSCSGNVLSSEISPVERDPCVRCMPCDGGVAWGCEEHSAYSKALLLAHRRECGKGESALCTVRLPGTHSLPPGLELDTPVARKRRPRSQVSYSGSWRSRRKDVWPRQQLHMAPPGLA